MSLSLPPGARVLFQGDSITDAGRRREPPADDLGGGYAALAVGLLRAAGTGAADCSFVNRGISGNRVADLRARWQEDTIALKPDLVSVMVGINDTWRRYDSDDPTSTEAYARDYRAVLTRVRDELGARILLIEPFLVPVEAGQWSWREDLDPRIAVVRRLAEEFDATLLAADGVMNQAARQAGSPRAVTDDGVHPTPHGHRVLARAWADLVTIA